MSLRTPLGAVRGLGSAKSGVGHYWAQRITAVALVPLSLWFVCSLGKLAGADYATFHHWLGQPFHAAMMLAVTLGAVWHGSLGLQVVFEDYLHKGAIKWAALIGTRLVSLLLALYIAVSVLKVAFGG